MSKIAVLLTCFNRRQLTMRCLDQLFAINQQVDVYLVDDNSTDGTSELIKQKYPQINLIHGTGNLFWSRGMHLAWKHASETEYDFYIWLNDDTFLYNESLTELMACSELAENKAIIAGIIESQDKSETLYGGQNGDKKILAPNGCIQAVTFMNGNTVLIPKSVFQTLGNLDNVFHHDLGDVDYGLRAIEHEISVLTTRIAIGSGEKNDVCRVRLGNSTLIQRFATLYSPLGNNPRINFYFRRKHFGFFNATCFYVYLHVINVLPDGIVKIIFGSKYLNL